MKFSDSGLFPLQKKAEIGTTIWPSHGPWEDVMLEESKTNSTPCWRVLLDGKVGVITASQTQQVIGHRADSLQRTGILVLSWFDGILTGFMEVALW